MFWIILNAITLPFTVIVIYFLIKFARTLLRMEEAVSRSLDILDNCYKNISSALERPLFIDNSEVRQVIADVKAARDAVLYVANSISLQIKYDEDEDEEI